jgi:hypothetical protein
MRKAAFGLVVGLWTMTGMAGPPGPTGVSRAADPQQKTAAATEGNLHFRNDAGSRFELMEARFSLDGQDLPLVFTHAEPGQDLVVVAEPLAPGRHVVSTQLLYRIKGRKIFTYMNSYRFSVRSEEVLTALPDRSATFTIVGAEKKGINTPIDKTLKVNVETTVAPPEPAQAAGTGLPGSDRDDLSKE